MRSVIAVQRRHHQVQIVPNTNIHRQDRWAYLLQSLGLGCFKSLRGPGCFTVESFSWKYAKQFIGLINLSTEIHMKFSTAFRNWNTNIAQLGSELRMTLQRDLCRFTEPVQCPGHKVCERRNVWLVLQPGLIWPNRSKIKFWNKSEGIWRIYCLLFDIIES